MDPIAKTRNFYHRGVVLVFGVVGSLRGPFASPGVVGVVRPDSVGVVRPVPALLGVKRPDLFGVGAFGVDVALGVEVEGRGGVGVVDREL